MPDQEHDFDFESEFALLDVGATSTFIRNGTVRPAVVAFLPSGETDAVLLEWSDDVGRAEALEAARRFLRARTVVAYSMVALLARGAERCDLLRPGGAVAPGQEHLAILLVSASGTLMGILYPVWRRDAAASLGMPTVTDAETSDWCAIGDIWSNPFCTGDIVQFRPRERAVDPGTPLWRLIVELTKQRIQDDQANADTYMSFLDDVRNGVFVVVGRPEGSDLDVVVRPQGVFNPIGTLTVDGRRLMLHPDATADSETPQ